LLCSLFKEKKIFFSLSLDGSSEEKNKTELVRFNATTVLKIHKKHQYMNE